MKNRALLYLIGAGLALYFITRPSRADASTGGGASGTF